MTLIPGLGVVLSFPVSRFGWKRQEAANLKRSYENTGTETSIHCSVMLDLDLLGKQRLGVSCEPDKYLTSVNYPGICLRQMTR